MKKIVMLLTVLALLLAALPGALADNAVMYLDANGNERTTTEAEDFKSSLSYVNGDTSIGAADETKWYYVSGTVEVNAPLSVYGDVHLILLDGATLTVTDSIILANSSEMDNRNDASLTIYAQSLNPADGGMGRLITNGAEQRAGIFVHTPATLTINGGYIEVTGADGAAGIGGKYSSSTEALNNAGTVIINGGVVIAQGGTGAAGIGGGANYDVSTTGELANYAGYGAALTINGGLVTAIGGDDCGRAIGFGHGEAPEGVSTSGCDFKGTLTLGGDIAVYDDTKDVQLTGSADDIFSRITGADSEGNYNDSVEPVQRVVFETHNEKYTMAAHDAYVLPNGKLIMTANGALDTFQYVRLDNQKLNPKIYTATGTASGTTVMVDMQGVSLIPDTVHTLSFIYPDGTTRSADGQFSVVLQAPVNPPQTGDSFPLLLYVGLLALCGLGAFTLLRSRKRA
ncbi:MAG: LPXTG cell wall anchor domain-containing protein [Aristaeellaceae bacterium]